MQSFLKRAHLGLKRWLEKRGKPTTTPVKQIHTKRSKQLSKSKQEKLEVLCKQLFKQKELITSGKLQLIGLQKIKKRMGKQWDGLSKIVYETAEDVIDAHMDKGDIFIRYKDDSYVMIFAYAGPEESRLKAATIAREIQERLFALDEEELKDIEIRQAVSEIRSDMFMEAGFLDDMPGAMDFMFDELEKMDGAPPDENAQILETLNDIDAVEVETTCSRAQTLKSSLIPANKTPDIKAAYIPLWDTKKGALTTYLCMARNNSHTDNLFEGHRRLYEDRSHNNKTKIDIAVLEAVGTELKLMEADGRKFFIVCPANHATLYNMESFEFYKQALSKLPTEHRQFLLIFVMNVDEKSPPKNAYWFAKPLRTLCPHVFADIPLRRDINFNYLHNSGVDVAGFRLAKGGMAEPDLIPILNSLSGKAKALKINKTFVFDVSSLSVTTSAVCAGFDFLGGAAIHGPVEKPDSIHRYHHADLIKQLSNK